MLLHAPTCLQHYEQKAVTCTNMLTTLRPPSTPWPTQIQYHASPKKKLYVNLCVNTCRWGLMLLHAPTCLQHYEQKAVTCTNMLTTLCPPSTPWPTQVQYYVSPKKNVCQHGTLFQIQLGL